MEKQADVTSEEPTVDLAELARKEWESERKEPETEEYEPSEKKPEDSKPEPKTEPEPKAVPEEKPVAVEAKPEEPKVDAKPEEKKEELDEKFVSDWAIKHSLTLAEAKEDLEKTRNVVKKYQTPEEMARALRLTQSEYEKAKAAAGAKTEQDPYQISTNPRLEVFEYVRTNAQTLLQQYRNAYPAKSRDMEDDAILEECADKLLTGYSQFNEQKKGKLRQDASVKRDQLLSTLSESDRKYLPDVKAVLDKYNDSAVMSSSFNIGDIVHWAKGQQFDKAIKEAEERGAQREREKAKILGVVPSSRTESTPPAQKSGIKLSAYEQKLAREMFATTTFSDEEKYEAYAEVTKKNKRK